MPSECWSYVSPLRIHGTVCCFAFTRLLWYIYLWLFEWLPIISHLCGIFRIAEAIEHSNRVEFNDYAIFFTFICNLLPYVRRSQLDFMQLLLKSSRYMLDLSSPAAERKIINEFPKNFPQASQVISFWYLNNVSRLLFVSLCKTSSIIQWAASPFYGILSN